MGQTKTYFKNKNKNKLTFNFYNKNTVRLFDGATI